ncbi:MAG: hypothetical protein ACETWK_05250 [Candidatus Aminicenantaceae bacterium]
MDTARAEKEGIKFLSFRHKKIFFDSIEKRQKELAFEVLETTRRISGKNENKSTCPEE